MFFLPWGLCNGFQDLLSDRIRSCSLASGEQKQEKPTRVKNTERTFFHLLLARYASQPLMIFLKDKCFPFEIIGRQKALLILVDQSLLSPASHLCLRRIRWMMVNEAWPDFCPFARVISPVLICTQLSPKR